MFKRSPARCGFGALTARFRRPRLLIVGCGDIGLRVAHLLSQVGYGVSSSASPRCRFVIRALTSSPSRIPHLRAQGITPLKGNLDQHQTLFRLAGVATHVLHLAPPPGQTQEVIDPRTRNLMRVLRYRRAPELVYVSTTAVYGDASGSLIDETSPPRASLERALRRLDAEGVVRHYGRNSKARSSILRVPGIYAPDRDGGTPRTRLLKGLPVLNATDDVYSSHIHGDDLARSLIAALFRGANQRIYNACDDTDLKMGDYFDLAADLYGLPRPPRLSREQAREVLSPLQMSYMNESRRLRNVRLKRELRVRLWFPTVAAGLV